MSSHRKPIIRIARVILEAMTPLSVSTGSPDGVFDTNVVTDANGLPAIPASSLAGVLRHLWQDRYGADSSDTLFGYQHGAEGQKSSVSLSWGVLLDSKQQPVEGLLLGDARERLSEDPLLSAAAKLADDPVFRNRVRLTHKGAAAHRGKFDRAVVPAGNRFAFELSMEGGDDEVWNHLLKLLQHPGFRLGGGTRAGLGRVMCVSMHERSFDLKNTKDINDYVGLSTSLADTGSLNAKELDAESEQPEGWLSGVLHLKAVGLWRIGQGTPDPADGEKPADFLPVTEPRIDWNCTEPGELERELLVPASALKGALAHRFRFHANRLAGRWADSATIEDGVLVEPECPENDALFGEAAERDKGRAGCLYLDDVFIDPAKNQRQRVIHNSIDRFTGSVRDRVLFEEECLIGGSFKVPIALDQRQLERFTGCDDSLKRIRKALALAIQDLLDGRLALGSKTSAGNGFFKGEIGGPLADWLEDGELPKEPRND